MLAYILRRLLLMIPTILGIMAVSFAIVQFVPGGPVERAISQLQGADQSSTAQFGGGGGQIGSGGAQAGGDITSRYRGSQGLDPKFIKELEKQYGFDKPALERFWILVRDYSTFNFGKSYYRDVPVLELIKEKLPVSISLGMWMTSPTRFRSRLACGRRSRTAPASTR
jgi:microcin C transport system permease protein